MNNRNAYNNQMMEIIILLIIIIKIQKIILVQNLIITIKFIKSSTQGKIQIIILKKMNVILIIQIVDENKDEDEYDSDNILSQIQYRKPDNIRIDK